MKKLKFLSILLVSIFITSTTYAYEIGSNVIKNESNQPWKFIFSSQVVVNGKSCFLQQCQVEPQTEAKLIYLTRTGKVYIESSAGKQKAYYYYTTCRHRECNVYIQHDGESNTGGVSLNEPENGSMTISQDNW